MVALYRCGRQAEALRAYADLRATLVEQLGIDPSPALGRLQEAILRQDRELDWPAASKGPAPAPAPPATAPDLLGSARSAMRRCRWQEAFDLFSAADQRGGSVARTSTSSPRRRSGWAASRARLLLAEALERQGDRKHAHAELDAARTAFDALGARLDLQRAEQLLATGP